MTKSYKEYPKTYIGESDISEVLARFCEGDLKEIRFGEDGSYSAYIVDENAIIGEHYELVAEGKHWLWIYDDSGRTFRVNAPVIRIYRAAMRGCIIQTLPEGA